ncbi:MAG: uroporphyrinogen-III synthase [Acidimicrobiales bacterium]
MLERPTPAADTADAPLRGFTVGITADRRWDEQAELLRRRGASVLHGPSIRTLPLGPGPDLRLVTEELIAQPPDILLANTGIGIRSWFAAADSWGLGEALQQALRGSAIYARGPKASAEVHRAGLDVAGRAPSERLEELVAMLPLEQLAGARVAFQRHGDDAPDTITTLVAAGAQILEVPVYRWILPDDPKPALRLGEAIIAGGVHALTFTAAPAVRNFFALLDEEGLGDAVRARARGELVVACVGPVCAAAAEAEGLGDLVIPDRFRLGPLVRAVGAALVQREIRTTLHGQPVVVRGGAVVLEDRHVELTDREGALLRTLLEEPRALHSKAELLSRVWGERSDDPHAVEVMVSRLRRTLGAAGAGIVSVARRGYVAR